MVDVVLVVVDLVLDVFVVFECFVVFVVGGEGLLDVVESHVVSPSGQVSGSLQTRNTLRGSGSWLYLSSYSIL